MVISMCVHIFSPPKNWSQRRSFMKIGSTIKGRHHLSDWVVGEDYLWVCILSDIKECIPCNWQEMYQNWLFEMNLSETGFFSSASHGALEVNQVCTLESRWTYTYFQVPRQWQWSKEVHHAQEIIQSVLVRRQKSSVGFNWVALEDCSQALAGIGCGCLAAEWYFWWEKYGQLVFWATGWFPDRNERLCLFVLLCLFVYFA